MSQLDVKLKEASVKLEPASDGAYDHAMPRRPKQAREVRINFVVTAAEHALLHAAAEEKGQSFSDWARQLLLPEAKRILAEAPERKP
jgi:hypothetical protein